VVTGVLQVEPVIPCSGSLFRAELGSSKIQELRKGKLKGLAAPSFSLSRFDALDRCRFQ
jgi:hypothetical protein